MVTAKPEHPANPAQSADHASHTDHAGPAEPTLRQRLVVPAYKGAAAVARALPKPVAVAAGTGLGVLLRYAMRSRRLTVERHQQRLAGGTLSTSELEAAVNLAFASYAKYWVDAFRLPGKTTAEIDAGITIEGREYVDAALEKGNGLIMAMPHIGAWDYGGAWVGHHWPLTVVAERLEPPELFEWFCEQRKSNGINVIPLGPEAGSGLLRALKNNEVLGLLCDRDIAGDGVTVEFFGEKTTLPAGPATLSLRTGAAILPNAVFQEGDRVRGVIRPPIEYTRTGRFRDDVAALTQVIAHELEELIRRAPEQWHVFQPNWPSDHLSDHVTGPVA